MANTPQAPTPNIVLPQLTPSMKGEPALKPVGSLFKSPLDGSSPNSLNCLIASGTPLKSARASFAIEMKARRPQKDVSFDKYGYGYGYGADEDPKNTSGQEQPPTKRRRFQRRNSKTPAMLMAMKSPLLLQLDFLEEAKDQARLLKPDEKKPIVAANASAKLDCWEGGLEIAEELVKHLQGRRKSSS